MQFRVLLVGQFLIEFYFEIIFLIFVSLSFYAV